jgi:hypothetical protein
MRYLDGGYYVPLFNSGTHGDYGFIGYRLEFPIPARRIIGHQDTYTYGKRSHIHYPSALKWAHIETHDVLMIAARIKDALELRPVGDETCRELGWDTWLPLMEKWVVQQHLSPEFEDRLYRSTLESVVRVSDRVDHIFAYFIRLLRTSDNLETQRFAAEWLERLNSTKSPLKTIEELQDKISNRETRRRMEELIKATTRRLRS